MAFDPITTQEALDKIIGDRLAREKAKFADYDDLKEKAGKYDELKTKSDKYEEDLSAYKTKESDWAEKEKKYTADITAKDAEIDKYKKNEARVKAAREAGLPFELADRITGDTAEDMAKDATNLKKFFNHQGAPAAASEPAGKPGSDDAYITLARSLAEQE